MSKFLAAPGCHPPNGYASSGTPGSAPPEWIDGALLRSIARHPVLAFMVIGLGAGFLTAAIRPIAEAEVLPYALPLHGFLGGLLGVGVGAFLVTAALAGRDGVVDLRRRCALARPDPLVSRYLPFRWEQRSSRSPSMAHAPWRHLPVAGSERLQG
jgi:hypothetical protein